MKKGFLANFLIFVVLIFVLYHLWDVPFVYFGKKVILPIFEAFGDSVKSLTYPFEFIKNLSNLDKANKVLEEENNSLKAEVAKLKETNYFCHQFEKEMSLSKISDHKLIVGKVIGRAPQSFNQNLVVDRGRNDGVIEGAAVLSSGFLIGQTRNVTDDQSEIFLITNHNSLVPAVLEKSREIGLVQGGLEGLILTEIPASRKTESGEKVLTSGLGGKMVPGILIGEVKSEFETKGLFQTIKISSSVQASAIEFVSIIQ